MTLTKEVQRIVAREIRLYILPLPFCSYNDPAMIAKCLNDELWLRWRGYWASCYIPLRAVCKVFRCLHLGELMHAAKARGTTTVHQFYQGNVRDFLLWARPKMLSRKLTPGQMRFAKYIKYNHTLRELRLEARELGLETARGLGKQQMARAIVASFDSTSECSNPEDPKLNGSVACKGDQT